MAISYAEASSSYPTSRSPCDGPWVNQCAIRMSIALQGAGFDLGKYTDPTCSHGHARGAESLANHLWRVWGRPRVFTNAPSAEGEIGPHGGIIFFKDIEAFRNGTGDHIDLWNGVATKTGEYFSYSKQVWFYRLI